MNRFLRDRRSTSLSDRDPGKGVTGPAIGRRGVRSGLDGLHIGFRGTRNGIFLTWILWRGARNAIDGLHIGPRGAWKVFLAP